MCATSNFQNKKRAAENAAFLRLAIPVFCKYAACTMVFLGIDPGTRVTGYAIMRKQQHATQLLTCGMLKFNQTAPLTERVGLFAQGIEGLIEQWQVTAIALETPFLGKNAQNFLKLGYLRGIVHFLCHRHTLSLHEFAPREIKQAITGFGGADKDQVARALHAMFPGLPQQQKEDITDAIAIAVCGIWSMRSILHSVPNPSSISHLK